MKLIELFLSDVNGQVMCIADEDGKGNGMYPIPDGVLFSDKEDLLEAAEIAFQFFNNPWDLNQAMQGLRSMSVNDYIAITDTNEWGQDGGTYIFKCLNSGWAMLMSDGQWEVM